MAHIGAHITHLAKGTGHSHWELADPQVSGPVRVSGVVCGLGMGSNGACVLMCSRQLVDQLWSSLSAYPHPTPPSPLCTCPGVLQWSRTPQPRTTGSPLRPFLGPCAFWCEEWWVSEGVYPDGTNLLGWSALAVSIFVDTAVSCTLALGLYAFDHSICLDVGMFVFDYSP